MTGTEIVLIVLAKALVLGGFEAITGREMFPANPKGPLYRWFGKPKDQTPTHE